MDNDSKLTLIEHLVELRRRIIIILVALVIGMGVAWNFSPALLTYITRPLSGQTYLTEIKRSVYAEVRERFPAMYRHYQLDKEMSQATKERPLNYSAPLEPFFVQCKISLIAGFVLVLPVVFQQIWAFIAPGLTSRERRLVLPFILFGTLSFCLGAFFFLSIIWPVIINFSLSYEATGLQSWFNLTAYVNFCLRLIMIFGLIFELPVASMVLARAGLVNGPMLAGKRRIALVASAIIAAFHADLITMFVVMVPLYLMYEVSVWVAYLFARRREAAVPAEG